MLIKIKLGLWVLVLLIGPSALAGIFSSEPSGEFKALEVSIPYSGGGQGVNVGEFYSGLDSKDGGLTKSWTKDSDSKWILTITVDDKMTGKKQDMKILLEKAEKMAVVTRFIAGGAEIPPAYYPNLLLPFVEVAKKKAGINDKFIAEKRAKEDVPSTAPPALLSGEVSSVFESGKVTIQEFVKYLNTIGTANWRSDRDGIYVQFVWKKNKKKYSVRFDKSVNQDNEGNSTSKVNFVTQASDQQGYPAPNDVEIWLAAAIKKNSRK